MHLYTFTLLVITITVIIDAIILIVVVALQRFNSAQLHKVFVVKRSIEIVKFIHQVRWKQTRKE